MPGIAFRLPDIFGVFRPELGVLVQMRQLAEQDQCLEIGHAVVVADQPHRRRGAALALLRAALVTDMGQPPEDIGKLGIIGDACAAFAGRQDLRLLEAEAADIADGADMLAGPAAAVGVGAVFDDFQVVLAGDLHDAVHVRERTEKVHGDHGLGLAGDRRFHFRRIHAQRVGLDIDHDRGRAAVNHRFAGRQPGMGRHDHFIARADPQRLLRQFQRDGPVGHHVAVFRAGVFGELFVEQNFLRSVERPLSAQVKFFHLFGRFRIDRRPCGHGCRSFEDFGSAVDCKLGHFLFS